MDDVAARELVGRTEELLADLEGVSDPRAREVATELVGALVELYGEGLDRIVGRIAARDDGTVAAELADDELVSHLLSMHDLHPVPIEARVREALEAVRPYLSSHGGDVEVLGVDDGVARLRLEGSCSGCPSSAVTLKLAIEDAIHKAVPEIERVEAEGAEAARPPGPQLLQVEIPGRANGGGAVNGETKWTIAGGMPELAGAGSGPLIRRVAGEELAFVKLGDDIYAYRPGCPGCGERIGEDGLEGTALRCAGCGNRYDVLRAGRCLDSPDLHLEPLPLLVGEDGLVKVAVGAAA